MVIGPIIVYSKDDFAKFRAWLSLDEHEITWKNKYRREFEKFWDLLFLSDLSLRQLSKRLDNIVNKNSLVPLSGWMNWLNEKVLIYTFINFDISVFELSIDADIPISRLSFILRNYFLHHCPDLDLVINQMFSIPFEASDNSNLKFKDLDSVIVERISSSFGSSDDEIFRSLEVTLYQGADRFVV